MIELTERQKDKVRVKRTLHNSNATSEDITKALVEYFRKHTMKDVLKKTGREDVLKDLDTESISVAANDVLTIFDGTLGI